MRLGSGPMRPIRLPPGKQTAYGQAMPTQDNIPLSPSEKLTLRYIAEGELHPRELDWLALQRLKQAGLLQARPHGLKMTPEGMRALQRVLAGN